MAPKPEIIAYLELWQRASKFQRQIQDFDDVELDKRLSRWSRQRPTARNCKRLCCNFRLSVVVAIAQGQFLRAGRGRKPQIYRWNCHPICHSSRDISISGFGGHIAISGCRSLSQSPGVSFFALGVVDNPMLAIRIAVISVILSDI